MSHPPGDPKAGRKLLPGLLSPRWLGAGKRVAAPATRGAHVLLPSELGPTELE